MVRLIRGVRNGLVHIGMAGLLLFAWNAEAAYVPPVGIPAPSFGIDEATPDSATKCPNWPAAESAGCYYIDSTSGSATDSSNSYGYPNRPRASIPTTYAAGSFVMVRGGPYNSITLNFNGTAGNPVIFNGGDSSRRTTIHGIGISGRYGIVEYVNSDLNGANVSFIPPASYLSFRNSTVIGTGAYYSGNNSAVVTSGSSSSHNNNIVIYRNTIRDHGEWNNNTTNDVHGVKPRNDCDEIWILENLIYHVQGDSIQTGEATLSSSYPTKIYIGKNTMYENKENCVDIKGGTDIVVSENICHDMLNGASDDQMEGIVTHNSADYTWYINNTIWNTGYGIYASGSTHQYAIGNVIYSSQGSSSPTSYYDKGYGILFYSVDGSILNNTIDNCQHGYGIVGAAGGAVEARENIITGRTLAGGQDQAIESTSRGHTVDYTLTNGSTKTRWGGGAYTTAAAFSSSTGQGAHHWEADPQYTSGAAHNYRIPPTSVAVDKGVLAQGYVVFNNRYGFSIQKDMDGSVRPSGGAWDLGAFESAGTSPVREPLPPSRIVIQ